MIKGIFLFYKKLARKFLSPASPHVAAHIPATQACLQVQLGGSGLLGHPALSKPLRCHLTTWVGWKLPLGTAEAHSIFLGPGSSPPALGPIALQHPLSRLHWSPDWQKHAWMQQRGDKLCELTSLLQLWKSNGEKIKKKRNISHWTEYYLSGSTCAWWHQWQAHPKRPPLNHLMEHTHGEGSWRWHQSHFLCNTQPKNQWFVIHPLKYSVTANHNSASWWKKASPFHEMEYIAKKTKKNFIHKWVKTVSATRTTSPAPATITSESSVFFS